MDWQTLNTIGSFFASVVVILGIPIGFIQYFRTMYLERQEQKYSAFDNTDRAYQEFLKICLEYPRLDIFDFPDKEPFPLTLEEKKQELIALTMLIGVLERAYITYQSAPSSIVKRQWAGWEEYIIKYCKRAVFKQAWELNCTQYDVVFQSYIQKIMQENQ